jgi:hypothetical protein
VVVREGSTTKAGGLSKSSQLLLQVAATVLDTLARMLTAVSLVLAAAVVGGSREWIHRIDNTRYDIDINSILMTRPEREYPVIVGVPVMNKQCGAIVKIATWNVANMSTTEASLAHMTSVLNNNRIDFLALTETHLTDDLLVGRLRSMNWNVEVRERDNGMRTHTARRRSMRMR